MSLMQKMERKFGKYAIRNLPLIMILLTVAGYLMELVAPNILSYMAFYPPAICRGQIWRLITWVLIPPTSPGIFTVIMLFFYYWIARMLAQAWGDFYFNIYILGGLLITDIGMMIAYPIFLSSGDPFNVNIILMSSCVTTFYVQTSIMLAFAFTYPDAQAMLYFIIPVKMSWLGIFYGVLLVYDFVRMDYATPRLVIILSLLNFMIYFLSTRKLKLRTPRWSSGNAGPRRSTGSNASPGRTSGSSGSAGRTSSSSGSKGQPLGNIFGPEGKPSARAGQTAGNHPKIKPMPTRHKCTICGKTERDDPNMEFRFCSKCAGSHEYCMDHLHNHEHFTTF